MVKKADIGLFIINAFSTWGIKYIYNIYTHTHIFRLFFLICGVKRPPNYIHAFILTTPTIKKQALKLIPFAPRQLSAVNLKTYHSQCNFIQYFFIFCFNAFLVLGVILHLQK